ncbi:guanitoxin biosynthesis heme-dependent pre-guanitoxin N-hydroxylase GntA [Thermomonas sp.]|uniref:guanitoxin biosynthesis heme-dependent pre-guanitoxin N-hydroxylase GntA n=1 Tax=Thermomonas sp. TaxID=1971895 RepID=UPI002487EC2B|nr:guanitoxin biosynthesis heme-dependent pre-guanitoxin N-hydroxylase GntA [Thermomonas sp.]MDI1253630.1 guanitoxin biosynthesis heme-dependent pre-guanitoxin N-hydroxylase GntA [Thermomonas sp.]
MHASPDKAATKFQAHILEAGFPCLGAKSALRRGQLEQIVAGDLRCGRHDAAILDALVDFSRRHDRDSVFFSCVVLFPGTPLLDEPCFEAALWDRLAALHRLDASQHAWDPRVSSDPSSPNFSMSLGGHAFYVVGMHPGASRQARCFETAALVFNPHSQFETLRANGRYDALRDTVASRDLAFAGSRNPMLAAHGSASAARQYSGRAVAPDWACPFQTSKSQQ